MGEEKELLLYTEIPVQVCVARELAGALVSEREREREGRERLLYEVPRYIVHRT